MASAVPTILVVEDEGSIASFVSLYLKNAGYAVKTAATGGEALSQVAAQYWLDSEQTVDRDEAVALLASLAWRGLAGFPLIH